MFFGEANQPYSQIFNSQRVIRTFGPSPFKLHQDFKIGHAFLDSDVRVFIIEATALQTFEHRLNLPSLPVHVKSFRSKGMKLWLSFLVLDFRPRCGVVEIKEAE